MREPKVGEKVRRLTTNATFQVNEKCVVSEVIDEATFRVDGGVHIANRHSGLWELIEEGKDVSTEENIVACHRAAMKELAEGQRFPNGSKVKEMRFNDLRAGMRVETRNGEQGLVFSSEASNLYLLIKDRCQEPIRMGTYYRPDLTAVYNANEHHNDIMKVWNAFSLTDNCDLSKRVYGLPCWERKEAVKITMALALEILRRAHDGREVEIINEEDELSYRLED